MINNLYFKNKANEYFTEIQRFRRTIHQNPELSFCEVNTSKFISDELNKLGIENHFILQSKNCEKDSKIGVIGIIGKGGKCVGLRADIDALPIFEETGLPFSSVNNGVMHACGHDMHTAMLLGAAKILKEIETKLTGKILLIFQPAEEFLPGGAKLILETGMIQQHNPSAIFGQHINPELNVGEFAVKSGPLMASTDELHITINGKGSHAGQPHLGSDVILAASQLIQFFQNIITKFKNPLEPAIISITSFQSGTVTNIYPDSAKLLGTMRTYNQELRNKLKNEINQKSKLIAELYDCQIDLNIVEGYPPVINSEETTTILENVIRSTYDNNSLIKAEPKMWAEDFAYYSTISNTTFYFIGVRSGNDEIYPLHNCHINPNEEALKFGTSILANVAYTFLNEI
jgi:amidohydrolase/hippurate hydrolase